MFLSLEKNAEFRKNFESLLDSESGSAIIILTRRERNLSKNREVKWKREVRLLDKVDGLKKHLAFFIECLQE